MINVKSATGNSGRKSVTEQLVDKIIQRKAWQWNR